MTQEEKELLLKDLCARLPYNVKVKYYSMEYPYGSKPVILTPNLLNDRWENISSVQPYLRQMSSMTEEENSHCDYLVYHMEDWLSYYDYLDSRYMDHRGLIEKGLALVAPRDMYQ